MLDSSNASEEEVKEGDVKPHPTIILRKRRNAAVSKKSGKLSFKLSDQKREPKMSDAEDDNSDEDQNELHTIVGRRQ